MSPNNKPKYPNKTFVVYLSAVTTAMSVALAFMLLDTPYQLLGYFAATSVVTAVAFFLKSFLFTRMQKTSENDAQDMKRKGWKNLILLFSTLVAFIFVPLFLAGYLDPYVWFIFIISLTSGFSIAEILLYLQAR
jgi:hypothetical protein